MSLPDWASSDADDMAGELKTYFFGGDDLVEYTSDELKIAENKGWVVV